MNAPGIAHLNDYLLMLGREITAARLYDYLPHDGGQPIDFATDTHDNPKPRIADGLIPDGPYASVQRRRIWNVRGVAASVTNTTGQQPTNGTELLIIDDNEICHCYTGAKSQISDTRISNIRLKGARDYGLHVARDRFGGDASSVMADWCHFYGAYAAAFVECSGFRGSNLELADALIGYHAGPASWNGSLSNAFIFHCIRRSMLLEAKQDVSATTVSVPMRGKTHNDTIGIDVACPNVAYRGGRIHVNWWLNSNDTEHAAAKAAVWLRAGANGCVFDTVLEGRPGVRNQRGFVVAGPIRGGRFIIEIGDGCEFVAANGDVAVEFLPAAVQPGNTNTTNTIWEVFGKPSQRIFKAPRDLHPSNQLWFNGERVPQSEWMKPLQAARTAAAMARGTKVDSGVFQEKLLRAA